MWESSTLRGILRKDIGGVFLDAGCGESPDADIALKNGFSKAYGIDLFKIKSKNKSEFIQGDICQTIPLEDNSVDAIGCHWVLPLLRDEERTSFYCEANRVLKPNGLFAYTGSSLAGSNKEPFREAGEKQRIEEAGLIYIHACIAKKE